MIAVSAFSFVKLASLIESPAMAQARREGSAPNLLTASMRVMKFPVDLDIFYPLMLMYPLQKYPLGHKF